jgi:hypothetical protein
MADQGCLTKFNLGVRHSLSYRDGGLFIPQRYLMASESPTITYVDNYYL